MKHRESFKDKEVSLLSCRYAALFDMGKIKATSDRRIDKSNYIIQECMCKIHWSLVQGRQRHILAA